jgi:hypothetical protein
MVIIPDSAAVADDLSFTIGQITWTTDVNSFTATATEEAQIRSARTTSSSTTAPTTLAMAPTTPATAPTTPTTRRPLPRYKGRMIDNTDLIEAIDQVGHKLSQTLTLEDSIQNQSTEKVLLHHNRSTRPVWFRHPTRLDIDLVVTTTPKGHTVCIHPVPTPGLRLSEYQALTEDCQTLPYGLKNIASEYVYRTPHLFMGPMERDHVSDLYFLDIPRPSLGNAVNMVRVRKHHEGSVHTLSEDGDSSIGSTRSVHTEVEHLEDDGYDLDLLPYPRVSLRS